MDIEKIKTIIQRKPTVFLFVSLGYLILISVIKWNIHPNWETVIFFVGGLLGVYFLDIAEVFFELNPSPFRSIVFSVAFTLVALFIVTSSGSALASGLVLSLYLSLILWQAGEWNITHNLNSWYRMVMGPVSITAQRWILIGFIVVFFIETFLFIR